MSPDVPDKPVSFARLQQQLILTEVELMKLEDLRDGLSTRVETANRTLQDMQRITDQACAERDHLTKRTAELEASLRQAKEQIDQLNVQAIMLAADAGLEKERAGKLAATLGTVEASLTWRLTAPFRALGRLFSR